MRHFSVFFLLLPGVWLRPASAQAQPTGSDSLSQKLTSIFTHIDKSQVPTGYLYEAGVRFFEPRYYNGVLSDSNRTDMDVLRYLRAQLRSSRVYGTDTLPGLPAFNARVAGATAAAGGAIPIAVQYQPYASIKPGALRDNLLTVQNEQVFDVGGRTQNPYQTNILFAAAPALSYARTNTVSFLFRRNLYLTSTGTVPSGVYLDFDDGRGFQPVTWGQPLGTTYATAGTKRLKVKVVYSTPRVVQSSTTRGGAQTQAQAPGNEVTYLSHFDFEVQTVVVANRYGDNGGTPLIYMRPANAPYGANVSIRYGRNHGQNVVKPFIVVEQYNIARAAPSLVDCNNANNTVELFTDNIENVTLQSGATFNETLEAAGYDLVYIDFEWNTDDITRNARVFEWVVQQINQRKSDAQNLGYTVYPNVVMGMSMGGLIARYGLADMTKDPSFSNFGPPDTRLLVLHDSPQRGAYNPVGLQSFARSCDVPLNLFEFWKVRDFKSSISDAINVLDEPATQQLAILSALNGRGDIRANTFIDGVYGDMVDFTRPINAGRPQPAYQIVATSDGAQCGRGSGAPLGVQLSSADTFTSILLAPTSLLTPFSLGVRGGAYGLPAYGQQAVVSRMRVYIEYRIRIGICPICTFIPIRYNLLNESAMSPPNTLPYETLPGGTTNLDRESGGCGNATGIPSIFLRTSLYNGDICFVPTYSALDVPVTTPATAAAKYINNTTDNPSLPRVARYIAQPSPGTASGLYNLNHLTFAPRNSEWIFNEMQGLTLPCSAADSECQPFELAIAGGPIVCTTGTTFTLLGQPAGAGVSWAVSPAGSAAPATGAGATFTPAAANATVGVLGTLTATVTVGCGTYTIAKPIALGKPRPGLIQGVLDTGLWRIQADVDPVLGATSYNWYLNNAMLGGHSTFIQFPVNRNNCLYGYSVQVEAVNACGVSARTSRSFEGCPPPRAALYPNPARETVAVRVDNATPTQPVTVRLFDGHGQPRAEQTSTGAASLQFSTAQLPAGLYFVHILRGTQVLSRQQLQIEK